MIKLNLKESPWGHEIISNLIVSLQTWAIFINLKYNELCRFLSETIIYIHTNLENLVISLLVFNSQNPDVLLISFIQINNHNQFFFSNLSTLNRFESKINQLNDHWHILKGHKFERCLLLSVKKHVTTNY